MICKRPSPFCRMAEIEQHQDLLVFRQSEGRCQSSRSVSASFVTRTHYTRNKRFNLKYSEYYSACAYLRPNLIPALLPPEKQGDSAGTGMAADRGSDIKYPDLSVQLREGRLDCIRYRTGVRKTV